MKMSLVEPICFDLEVSVQGNAPGRFHSLFLIKLVLHGISRIFLRITYFPENFKTSITWQVSVEKEKWEVLEYLWNKMNNLLRFSPYHLILQTAVYDKVPP